MRKSISNCAHKKRSNGNHSWGCDGLKPRGTSQWDTSKNIYSGHIFISEESVPFKGSATPAVLGTDWRSQFAFLWAGRKDRFSYPKSLWGSELSFFPYSPKKYVFVSYACAWLVAPGGRTKMFSLFPG